MPLIPFSDAAHLFTEFEEEAWRLETRKGYASDRSSSSWNRFSAGAEFGYDPNRPWHATVRAATRAGKRFARVRLVDSPPTEGQRFLLATGLGNVAAGEDIRNLWRADAEGLGLPAEDFWLFDSRLVARFVFDEDDVTLGVILSEDTNEVAAACRARDVATKHAIPTRDFIPQVPSRA
ncbi:MULTISPECIES: DUF6879 family protein [Streptomyces]|uniref:DUF6879 domain-containing protein n=1 Tax=Streptomyces evansiae TaxID=3075535 RepID=A0ABU2R165_9ACTN|nr:MULTISPECIES: DUF6879 family protein [unclassified Streptomyces]MDT0410458.1 hypothetical protein [Streptomyces sp. DSM 41979]MYQ61660.1 hypothetical protein [Streptomyces sp. SID4926]SCE25837.1 hypothetical protein GA0115252_138112 [Streptomyces sp. DfronAA-171]